VVVLVVFEVAGLGVVVAGLVVFDAVGLTVVDPAV
jgi:hypothetical protein